MFKNKRTVLSFLIVALLLLPVQSMHAYSWQDWQKWTTSIINKYNWKKIISFAAVGAFATGGLYYYWTQKQKGSEQSKEQPAEKQKSGEQSKEQPAQSKVDEQPEPVRLEPLQVYSQRNQNGGGEASCGYHALLRAMQVVRAKNENETDAELSKTLMNSNVIAAYLGKDGEWRKIIIDWRKEQAFRKILHENFTSTLRSGLDAKATDLYKSALGFLEDVVVTISKDPQRSISSYDFTDQAIARDIAKSLDPLKNEGNATLVEKLKNQNTIQEYFDFNAMRGQFLSKDYLLNLPKLINKINDTWTDTGEWLSDGEIELLWREKREDILPSAPVLDCGFKVVANFDLVDNPDVPVEFDEVSVYIQENVKDKLNNKLQSFQIFILGEGMKQMGDTGRTSGHWYPLVMHQNQGGKRRYYIMDSLGKDRTADTNALKIVKLIEGAK